MCGNSSGFGYMNTQFNLAKNDFICSTRVNPSHDLRLIDIIGKRFKSIKIRLADQRHDDISAFLKYLFENTNYGVGLSEAKQKAHYVYGTRSNPISGFTKHDTKMNNVGDVERILRDGVEISRDWNEVAHLALEKLGDIHVYSDETPMKFIGVGPKSRVTTPLSSKISPPIVTLGDVPAVSTEEASAAPVITDSNSEIG